MDVFWKKNEILQYYIIIIYKNQVQHYGFKINFSPAQVKKILYAHENTSIKLFNTATERLERKVDNLTTENGVLGKEMVELKSSV